MSCQNISDAWTTTRTRRVRPGVSCRERTAQLLGAGRRAVVGALHLAQAGPDTAGNVDVRQGAGLVSAKLLTLGGDHTIPYGLVRAAKDRHGPISLFHFDSHQDSESSDGDRSIFHGSFAHDWTEEGTVDPSRSVQVFIRTEMENPGYTIIHANEALYLSPRELAERIKAVLGANPVYITFDIDALDPAYAPGTATPVIGGPTTFFARDVLRHLRGLNVVAADIVEVLPAHDHSAITALAAATIGVDLLYLMADRSASTNDNVST